MKTTFRKSQISNEADANQLISQLTTENPGLFQNSSESEIEKFLQFEMSNAQSIDFLSGDQLSFLEEKMDDSMELNSATMELVLTRPLILPNYKKLKRKTRKVFCEIINELEGLDAEGIVGGILLALIPAFGAGIPLLIAPIVVGIILWLLKKGYNRVCPV